MSNKMRKLFAKLIVVFTGFAQVAFAQQWSSPVKLAAGNTPDLFVDRKTGKLHVLVTNNKVIYVTVDEDGKKIGQEDVPNTDGPIGRLRFGATIAVDSREKPHVVYHIHLGKNYYDTYYTYKSGSSWVEELLIDENTWRGYANRMAIDSNDDVHVIHGVPDVVGKVSATATYFRIANGRVISTIPGMQKWRIDDHLEIDSFGSNDVHIVLSRPDRNGKVYYHTSSNNGNSFSGPVNVRVLNNKGRPGNGDIFVDLLHNVHIVYGNGEDPLQNVFPSVRYHRRSGGVKIRDVVVTASGELLPWTLSTGIATVAASDNGRQVVVAYLVTDGGELRARISNDQGQTWSSYTSLANQSGCCESRDKPVIRANGRRFYVVYESAGDVWLRWIELGPVPPLANAGGPYIGTEGLPISFDASNSSSDEGIVEYAWDWESDGNYDDFTNGPIFQHAYNDDFIGTATLRIKDTIGAIDTAQVRVTINNAAPIVTITANTAASEGDSVSFTATVSDPGNDTFGNITWRFGDNNSALGINVTNTYIDNGQYTVQASVTDDDGATGTGTFQISILNVPPKANSGGPYAAIINQVVTFSGSATDPGANDVLSFAWDLNNDGTFEETGAQASTAYSLPGIYTIRFKATDDDGGSNVDVTQVNVGSGGPLALAIPDQQINEGQTFPVLNLDDYVTDPNNADLEITWSAFGNSNLAVMITNRQAKTATPDTNWWGQENVSFVAKDPTGFTDTTTAKFIVEPVNDPPVISKILNQSVTDQGTFQPVQLDNHVTDVDDPKNALIWNATGNKDLFVTVANRVATITRPSNNWFGSEVLLYTVTDTSGASDTMSVRYTAKLGNDPPVMSAIPSQTIQENQAFAPILLDQYVNDPDNNDEDMSWSVFGHRELKVSISIDRTVTIAPPDSEWAKSENISFVARDPWNNADTSTAAFTVVGINDPPLISGFGEYTINEDDSVKFTLQQLDTMIVDPDDGYSKLQYDFVGQTNLHVAFDENNGLAFYATEDWYGTESAWFRVSDGSAWNIALVKITVISQPDAPRPFDLILPVFNQNYLAVPETITFTWSPTTDPDEGDSLSHYSWQISERDDFSTLISSISPLTDTTTTFQAGLFLREPVTFQKYYWRVIATSTDGSKTTNRLQGRFTIGIVTDIEDNPADQLPNSIALYQNYPNPFNPSTRIAFELPVASRVKLAIYDVTGQAVRRIAEGFFLSGRHHFEWDARDDSGKSVASGIYIYKLETPVQSVSKKMILMQ
jgi:hypothetical protein